jgi:hypothetical protein
MASADGKDSKSEDAKTCAIIWPIIEMYCNNIKIYEWDLCDAELGGGWE